MASPTGLTQLGDALLRGTGDYANIQLRRQHEEKFRAQQLADLADSRRYQESQVGSGVDRQKEMFRWQQHQARIHELIAKGLLSEKDAMDDLKVAAADLADTTETSRLRGQKVTRDKDAQLYVNTLGKQANDIQDEIAETVKALNAIPKSPKPPSPREIDSLAKQLAVQEKADYKNNDIRQQYIDRATTQLEKAADYKFSVAQIAAKGYQDSLMGSRYRLDSITRQLTDMAKQDYFPAGSPPPVGPGATLAPPPEFTPHEATPSEKAAAAGGVAQPAPAVQPTASSPLAAALNDPSLAPGGVLRVGQQIARAAPVIADEVKGLVPAVGAGISAILPDRIMDTANRGMQAVGTGLWRGDFTVPETSDLGRAGSAIGTLLAPEILPGDYMSEAKARALRLRRSLDQPLPALRPLAPRVPAAVFTNPYMPQGY